MRKAITVATLAALGLTGTAFAADNLSYSYVELNYLNTELDDLDVEGDGFGVAGSLAFTPNLHGFASYGTQDVDDFDGDVDQIELGIGGNWPVSDKLDVIATVSYVDLELDGPGNFDLDDNGFALGGALRGRVTDVLELRGGIKYMELDELGDDTSLNLGARYYVTPMFALGADVSFSDDVTTWVLGARLDFGK
ncbi:MAG: outer membrane beta-barrel protein [Steroidobacteraceae bacterium]|nr:outer membrane beta-barrel protein [Steroidobacteraceae bacterium]